MKITLNWFKEVFKSEQQKELDNLKIEKKKLENELLSKQLSIIEKPYKNVKLVNDVLTIILKDGSILSKSGATVNDFINAKQADYEEELFRIASSAEGIEERKRFEKEMSKNKALKEGLNVLKEMEDFEVDGNTVFMKGTNRSLPPLLVEKFIEVIDNNSNQKVEDNEEYLALKRFFLWCCLNPRAEVADKLYNFLVKNSFRITKQGFFVALRNVVTVEKDNELVKFVSNSYQKIKAVWKKAPKDYWVFRDENGNYRFDKTIYIEGSVGNLQDLYLDLPNMDQNRFTDAHTQTFDIRVGQVVSMPPEECSWSTRDCAEAGLHFTSDSIHYVGCGDTSVLMLINPMKVVGIGEQKGRCYEYLPIMTVPAEEATEILHDADFDTLELDEQYVIDQLDDLTNKVKDGFAKEAKKYDFNIPNLSVVELDKIVLSLGDMKKEISNRIVHD